MVVPKGVSAGAKRTSSTVERRGGDEGRQGSVKGGSSAQPSQGPRQASLGRGLYGLWECGNAAETRKPPDPGETLKGRWSVEARTHPWCGQNVSQAFKLGASP